MKKDKKKSTEWPEGATRSIGIFPMGTTRGTLGKTGVGIESLKSTALNRKHNP